MIGPIIRGFTACRRKHNLSSAGPFRPVLCRPHDAATDFRLRIDWRLAHSEPADHRVEQRAIVRSVIAPMTDCAMHHRGNPDFRRPSSKIAIELRLRYPAD